MTSKRTPAECAWGAGVLMVCLIVAIPFIAVVIAALGDGDGAWEHLLEARLREYAVNTLLLALLVTSGALVLGAAPAWLVTAYRFRGSGALAAAALLPLAVPPYMAAYAYTDLFQFSGAVRTALRNTFGPSPFGWFPEPRSLTGAAAVLSLALSPYVFVVARQAFAAQGVYATRAARSLGLGPVSSFVRVAIPLAAPALLAGTCLVLMETIADFGVADYCAVDTFATGVYRAWLGMDDASAAARLALVLLLAVMVAATAARVIRARVATPHTASSEPIQPARLSGAFALAAASVCLIPVTFGFVAPVLTLSFLAWDHVVSGSASHLLEHAINSLTLAVIAGMVAVALAIVSVYGRRVHGGPIVRAASRLTLMGYAAPGTVIGFGLLVSLTAIDQMLNASARRVWGDDGSPGLLLTGSIFAIVLGCQTRFLAVSVSAVDAAFDRVRGAIDGAARTLGAGPTATLFRVHIPMCSSGLILGGVLVFADTVKELPMTLLLRPFNFDTLAVRAHQLASDERIGEAAACSLGVVALGVLPVALLWALDPVRKRRDCGAEGKRDG